MTREESMHLAREARGKLADLRDALAARERTRPRPGIADAVAAADEAIADIDFLIERIDDHA